MGRYEPDVLKMFDFRAERVLRSVDESLARLGLDYVDVIQVHDPEFCPNIDIILSETLPALQKVKDSGKARFIGKLKFGYMKILNRFFFVHRNDWLSIKFAKRDHREKSSENRH